MTLGMHNGDRVGQVRRKRRFIAPVAIVLALVACLTGLAGCALLGEWLNLPATYDVTGRVVDYETREGILGVLLQFDGGFSSVTTEADGTWRKEGLRGRVTVAPSKAGVLVFDPPTLTLTGPTTSANFVVVLTTQRLEGIVQASEQIDTHVEALYDPNRKRETLAAIAAAARGIDGVEWAEGDDSSVSVMYRYGGVQAWLFSPLPEPLEPSSAPMAADAKRVSTCASPLAVVGSRRAVIADALDGDPGYESTKQYLDGMQEDLTRMGFAVERWKGQEVTIDRMKSLEQYAFVFIQGHGNVVRTRVGDRTALQTGESYEGFQAWLPHEMIHPIEWYYGRLVLLTVEWGRVGDRGRVRTFWAVTSEFFTKHTEGFPQTVFIAWGCNTLKNKDLCDALASRGVQAYVGWKLEHNVHPQLAHNLVKKMACGETLGIALESIRPDLTRRYPGLADCLVVCPEAGRDARIVATGSCLTWEARRPLPTPRAWAPAVVYGGKIYVVGGVACTSGCAQFRNPSAALEVYDPASNTWESLPPMPTPRVGPAVAALNGRIYVMGGFNRDHGVDYELAVRRRMEIYDIATRTWTRGPDLLKPRAWGESVVLGNRIYVLGGVGDYTYSPGYHGGVEVYDPQTNTWSNRASFSGGRYLFTAVTANDRIYVIGGEAHDPDYTYDDIQEYNPGSNTWTSKAPMPSAAGGIDAVAVGGEIWVFGNQGLCRVYNLSGNRWEERTSTHDRAGGFSVAYLNDFVYRFGGGWWGPTSGVVERTRLR